MTGIIAEDEVFPPTLLIFSITEDEKAVVRRCSIKKVFLKFLQNSQENTCVRVSFLIKLKFNKEILA